MNRRCLIAVAALSLAAALGATTAAAGPPPAYKITCVVGDETTVTWHHEKIDQATLEWFAGTVTTPYASTTVPTEPKKPRGIIVSSAGVVAGYVPARVRVSFAHTVGSTVDHVEAPCA